MKNTITGCGKIGCALGALFCILSLPALAEVNLVTLANNKVEMKVTPDLGGRVLAFSVPGKPNVLLVNEENLAMPVKKVSHTTRFVEYNGHINWVSPQEEWWTRQDINPAQKKRRAIWPPDPFLIYGKNTVVKQGENDLVLEGVESPISGVKFSKQFQLVKSQPGSADLHVSVTNIRNTDVSWGIWFNTRVQPAGRVYVPIESDQSVRIDNYDTDLSIPAAFDTNGGFFSYERRVVPTKNKMVRSKAFIQPAQGWMAAFMEGQVFIIQFPLQAREEIHPAQGQVEIYHSFRHGDKKGGVVEMELHAPYRTLKPGEKMQAMERWTVLPFDGENTRAGHIAFLKNLADRKIIGDL